MSPTKNARPEKGSDLTGLLYRENIDYNGNILAPVGSSANYRAPNIEKNTALMEWHCCQKSSFFLFSAKKIMIAVWSTVHPPPPKL